MTKESQHMDNIKVPGSQGDRSESHLVGHNWMSPAGKSGLLHHQSPRLALA